MILAEKSGVFTMFDSVLWTFTPSNTAPDGSVTPLSDKLANNASADNPITTWMEAMLGWLSGTLNCLLVALAASATVLVVCGYCCIPCIQMLVQRLTGGQLIDTSIKTLAN